MPLTFVFVYGKNANVFDVVLGSDGNKQGTQYNKRRCIMFSLMMETEHIQCEGQALQCRVWLL